jgi:hypothetical protein
MTILDELAHIAREQRYGHAAGVPWEPVSRVECYISRVPIEWCLGCKRGWHKHTQQPMRGSEPDEEMPVIEVVPAEVAPAEITPADATPPEVEPPTVKIAEIVTDTASQVFGVPLERIDASALDTEIAGIEERPAQTHCACGTLLWFYSERSSGRCHKCSEIAALEQSLKDGVDEARKP